MDNVSRIDDYRNKKKVQDYIASQQEVDSEPNFPLSREAIISKLRQDMKTCVIFEAKLPDDACFDCHAPTSNGLAIDRCSVAPVECDSCSYAPCVGLCE